MSSCRTLSSLSLKKKLRSLFYSSRDVWRESGERLLAQSESDDQSEAAVGVTHHETKAWRKMSVEILGLSKSRNFLSQVVLGLLSWELTCVIPPLESSPLQFTMKSFSVIFALVSADFEPIGLNYQASWGCNYPDTGILIAFRNIARLYAKQSMKWKFQQIFLPIYSFRLLTWPLSTNFTWMVATRCIHLRKVSSLLSWVLLGFDAFGILIPFLKVVPPRNLGLGYSRSLQNWPKDWILSLADSQIC